MVKCFSSKKNIKANDCGQRETGSRPQKKMGRMFEQWHQGAIFSFNLEKKQKKNKPKPKCFIVKDQKYKNQKCFFIVQLLMSPFDKILSFYRPCIFLPK